MYEDYACVSPETCEPTYLALHDLENLVAAVRSLNAASQPLAHVDKVVPTRLYGSSLGVTRATLEWVGQIGDGPRVVVEWRTDSQEYVVTGIQGVLR